MTKLKKFMFGIVSIVTAFSMLAFTACGNSDIDDNASDETPTENTGNTDGSGDSTGNADGTQSGEEAEDDSIISKAIAATKNVTYKSAEIGVDIDYEDTYEYSYSYDTITSRKSSDSGSLSATILFDFDSFNYDLYTTETDDDGSYLSYSFVRDGYEFYLSDSTDSQKTASASDITSSTTLKTYYGDTVELDDIWGIILNEDYMQTLQTMPFAVVSLAERYDAVTVGTSTITVNAGMLVSSLYNEIITIINSVTENTTVADLLENDLVEDLLDAVSVGMDASEIYSFVISILGETLESRVVSAIKMAVDKPAEGTSLYEFICSIAEDEDLYSFVMNENGTFSAMTVAELIELIYGEYVALEDIKEELDCITVSYSNNVATMTVAVEYDKEVYGYTVSYSESYSISGDLIYTLNSDNALNSISFDGTMAYDYYRETETTTRFETLKCDIEATITPSTSAANLKDISSNPVNVYYSSRNFDTVEDYLKSMA